MNPASLDPNAPDFGTDVALLNDLAGVWGLASGDLNMAMSAARHLTQREGSMDFYDTSYDCFDIRGYCSARMNKARLSRLQGRIVRAQESDRDRVQRCTTTPTFNNALGVLTVPIFLQTNDGPFDLVLRASSVTVDLLSVNGVALPTPVTVASAAPAITIVQGGTEPGPPGPPGASNPSRSFGLQAAESSLGTEDPQLQTQLDEIDWGALGSSLTIKLGGMASDEGGLPGGSGVGVVKLRVNGSDGAADGTVEISINVSNAAATSVNGTATISNPGGLGRAILTVTSSAAGKSCLMRGITLVIQSN